MGVIGCAAYDRVDVFLLKTLSPVDVMLRIGRLLCGPRQSFFVDVAQGDNILFLDSPEVPAASATDAINATFSLLLGASAPSRGLRRIVNPIPAAAEDWRSRRRLIVAALRGAVIGWAP